METLLLPGMDGTGKLFARLLPYLPPELCAHVVSYPPDRALNYAELLRTLPVPEGPFAVVGESFSGPLAVMLAAAYPRRVKAVVLVATFVRHPVGWLGKLGARLGALPFHFRTNGAGLKRALFGRHVDAALLAEVRAVLEAVQPQVLAARLRSLIEVDVAGELAGLKAPVLCVSAQRDRLIPPAALELIRQLRPDATVFELDAPHLVLQHRPEEAGRAIAAFIKAALSLAPPA